MNEALDPKEVNPNESLPVENTQLVSSTEPEPEKEFSAELNEVENDTSQPVTEEKNELPEEIVESPLVKPVEDPTPGEVEIAGENISAGENAVLVVTPQESFEKMTKEQIIEKLQELVDQSVNEITRNEVDALKQAFYKIKRLENEEAKQVFIDGGGDELDFQPAYDEEEEKLKNLLQKYKDKKAVLVAEEEKQKEENLIKKLAIIDKLKVLIESQDDFYKIYNEFKKLQQEWKDIKSIPQSRSNEIWKEYQSYSEKFYDLLKINNEMRDYDFRKNLELKEVLCNSVEKLENEPDVISAFHQLQKFHQEWREIGPVAREFREDIWARFKKASAAVNKRHQDHFNALKELEQRNLEEKTSICEEMEAIDYDSLRTFKDWDEKNKRVLELQEKWKTIGFAPKKYNVKVFERFRAACDLFFQCKSDFYKRMKESMDDNLKKKEALCEIAESLKDSQDWKESTDKFIALQKEWKTIGAVSRKYSDAVWKRFITACDYFFEQKNIHFSSQKTEEIENLKLKKDLIERINEIDESLIGPEAVAQIRELMSEWNSIGFVPFKEKDKIYKEYREAIDKHFDRLKIDESERRLQNFRSNLNDMKSGERAKNKLFSERDKLVRTYERLKNDIQTYENNIGFLSVSSKGGGGLVKEMNRKIESLREELKLIEKKIQVIDENLDA